MNTGLDENETELGVLILAVALQVLSYSNGLFDELVEIFWDFWCKA